MYSLQLIIRCCSLLCQLLWGSNRWWNTWTAQGVGELFVYLLIIYSLCIVNIHIECDCGCCFPVYTIQCVRLLLLLLLFIVVAAVVVVAESEREIVWVSFVAGALLLITVSLFTATVFIKNLSLRQSFQSSVYFGAGTNEHPTNTLSVCWHIFFRFSRS